MIAASYGSKRAGVVMSVGGQVVSVLVALVVVWLLVRWMRSRRKRWGRPLTSRNVRSWSKSDKWQPWR